MLNRTTSDRVISKQECMIECTDLPLTLCSEMIQTISITGSAKIYTDKATGRQTLLSAYMNRPSCDESQTLSQFVFDQHKHIDKRLFVPHYVGMNNAPCYPVSPSYARATLIIHSPWRNAFYHRLDDNSCISEFMERMKTCRFPTTVKINYLQAKQRYERSQVTADNNKPTDNEDMELDEEDQFILTHMGTLTASQPLMDSPDINKDGFHRGLDYDWSRRHTVS